ncbi:MAG TPA: ABC transporter substrate-binding protein [Candidatus Acidoferrales bacterium]|nr:ABC transporter substrate-binding protein [Candidatus Acidoferrales bacterium]
MRIAVPDLISNSYFPAVAAVELGFMREQGLEVELELIFPVPKTLEELRAGRVDFVAGSAHSALFAFPDWRGAKLLMALAQRTYWLLVLRADLNAARGDLTAVKGLRIGAAPGVDLSLKRLLVEAGIDPERDGVRIEPVPGATGASVSFGLTAARALEEGKIDGFWANAMGAEIAVRRKIGTVVLDVRRGDGPATARHHTFPALLTTESNIAKKTQAVAAAIRAVRKAQETLRADPDRATQAARRLFPPAETELIAELIRRDLPYYDPVISEDAVMNMNSFAQAAGLLSRPVAYDEVVAVQFRDLWAA